MHSTLDLSELDSWIGRLFMAGIPGPQMDRETEALIRDHALGGVILFARNIQNPVQVATLSSRLQAAAMDSQGIPLFLSVDQEGGRVARLQEPFTLFPGNTVIGDDPNGAEMALEFGKTTAREMKLVGLNMDMAPVVDVRVGAPERHLDGRIFSDDPLKVAMLGQCVVKGLQENGVMAVAKHFPGLGRATRDPHHDLPTIEADMEEIEGFHLPPFRAAMSQGVSAVMTSHALYPALDPEYPGTLSHKIVTGLLRENLGFEGLIITDDLEMGAVKRGWGVAEAAVAAFAAGCDILLICRDQGAVLEGMTRLRDRLIREEIPLNRLHQSVKRVMAAKDRFLGKRTEVSLTEVRDYFGIQRPG
ncbi:MAG: Beta-N-acetylhexosaminidase [Thermodesulfobacteriota bacterium]|nr:Beta-N-acetylhexosaminidase [Thermodesulfobacteriota bacterium]